jgi:hypothetical protein
MSKDPAGYIKLYRQILDNPIVCKDAEYFAIWGYLLLSATHTEHYDCFNGQRIKLQPGQLITGRKRIADKFNISESKVQRVLKTFEIEQQIEQRTTPNMRLITILNWGAYQSTEQQNEQRVNNDRTTTEQRLNTIQEQKNVKNDKNINNIYSAEQKNALAPPPVITLILNDGSEYPITQNKVDEYKTFYPAVDVMQELRKMKAWCIDNATRRKTKRGILRFVNAWLSKEQDRGRAPIQQPESKNDTALPFEKYGLQPLVPEKVPYLRDATLRNKYKEFYAHVGITVRC